MEQGYHIFSAAIRPLPMLRMEDVPRHADQDARMMARWSHLDTFFGGNTCLSILTFHQDLKPYTYLYIKDKEEISNILDFDLHVFYQIGQKMQQKNTYK